MRSPAALPREPTRESAGRREGDIDLISAQGESSAGGAETLPPVVGFGDVKKGEVMGEVRGLGGSDDLKDASVGRFGRLNSELGENDAGSASAADVGRFGSSMTELLSGTVATVERRLSEGRTGDVALASWEEGSSVAGGVWVAGGVGPSNIRAGPAEVDREAEVMGEGISVGASEVRERDIGSDS